MPEQALTPATRNKKPAPFAYLAPHREGTRHTEHGTTTWLIPDADSNRQPQDGITRSLAAEVRTIQARVTAKIIAATTDTHLVSKLLSEPEDARLTGGTRSLMRRVLGLNVPKAPRKIESLRPARVA